MNPQEKITPNPFLDYEQLQMLKEAGAGEDSELFREILELYEEESTQKLTELERYSKDIDLDLLGKAAHALAGSSANIGGREVWRIAKEVENKCKEGDEKTAVSLVPELKAAYRETVLALHSMLSS